MQAAAERIGEWDGTEEHAQKLQVEKARSYEDGVLSLSMRNDGFKYAPKEEACKYAQGGNPNPEYYYSHPFGFHGAHQNIDHTIGYVSRVCIHNGKDCGCREEHLKVLTEMEA